MNKSLPAILLLVFLFGCGSSDDPSSSHFSYQGEYIYRMSDEHLFSVEPPHKVVLPSYPWEKDKAGDYPQLTKEYFRCNGSSLNPIRTEQQKGEVVRFFDCGGSASHSLPLRNGKEFVYPILIELMNYIQMKTGKRVVITSGHRCPEHHNYADSSPGNQYSKHMIGAEVAFYVQGLEEKPELLVSYLQEFYKETPRYAGKKEFEFQRYEKPDTNVVTQPWYNKEIFIKLFTKKEGRNFDNRHPYPYVSVQVRHDRDLDEKVIYTWDKAHHNYHRW